MRALLICVAVVGCLLVPGRACSDSPPEPRTVRRVALGAGDWQGERLFARALHRRHILNGRHAEVDSDRRAERTQIDFAAWLAARQAPKD
jgi:hypothetical protein